MLHQVKEESGGSEVDEPVARSVFQKCLSES